MGQSSRIYSLFMPQHENKMHLRIVLYKSCVVARLGETVGASFGAWLSMC